MSDLLLQINKKSLPGRLVTSAGLSLPAHLKRYRDGWQERFLQGQTVTVGGEGKLQKELAAFLPAAGADVHSLASAAEYKKTTAAYARFFEELSGDHVHEDYRTNALVFDATGIETITQLDEVYQFLHSYIRRVKPGGRVLILARPAPASAALLGEGVVHSHNGLSGWESAAVSQAMTGLIKSLAKETGAKGTTANVVYVNDDADKLISGALRFFLSPASAFITGQTITLSGMVKTDEYASAVRILEGKTVLLTGAARGIGAVSAAVLRKEGARLIALDRPEDREALAGTLAKTGGKMLLQDISAPDAARSIIDYVNEHAGGRLDAIIHNAGVTRDKTMGKMDAARWNQAIDINLKSVVHITEEIVPQIMGKGSRILCTSSIAGIAGNFGQTNYGAAKAGLIGFVQSAAPALAEKGIAINAVAPGFIETRMTAAIPLVTREAGRRLSALSQGGLPEDVGHAAAWLSSPLAAGVTGQVLRVCGANFLGA